MAALGISRGARVNSHLLREKHYSVELASQLISRRNKRTRRANDVEIESITTALATPLFGIDICRAYSLIILQL